jgi:hypothetical protein
LGITIGLPLGLISVILLLDWWVAWTFYSRNRTPLAVRSVCFSCISCMIFYLLERNSQSPAEANYLIWYSCEDWGVWEDELIFTWSLLGSCSGQFIQRLPWFLLNVKYIIPNVFVLHHGLKSICPVPVLSQLTDHCWQQFNVCLKGPAGCKLDFLLRGWIQFSWFAIVP